MLSSSSISYEESRKIIAEIKEKYDFDWLSPSILIQTTPAFPEVYRLFSCGFAHDYGDLTTYHGFYFKEQYYKKMTAGLSQLILQNAGWQTVDLARRKALAFEWITAFEDGVTFCGEEPAFKLPGAAPFRPRTVHVLSPQNHLVATFWSHYSPQHHGMRPPPVEPEPEVFSRRAFMFAADGWRVGFINQWTLNFHSNKAQTQIMTAAYWSAPFLQEPEPFDKSKHGDQDIFPKGVDLAEITAAPSAAQPEAPKVKPPPAPPAQAKPAPVAAPDVDRDAFASLLDKFDYVDPEERQSLMPSLEKYFNWAKLKPLFTEGKILMMRPKTFSNLVVLLHKPLEGKAAIRECLFKDKFVYGVDHGVPCQKSMQLLNYSTLDEEKKFRLLNAWVEEILGSGDGERFVLEPHPAFKLDGAPEFHAQLVVKRKSSGFPWVHKWVQIGNRFERRCWLFDSSGTFMKRFKEREIWFSVDDDCTSIIRGPFWGIKEPYSGEASYQGPN